MKDRPTTMLLILLLHVLVAQGQDDLSLLEVLQRNESIDSRNTVDVVFAVDLSNSNRDAFISQLLRGRETARSLSHIPGCTFRYGLVAFHRTAVSIVNFESAAAKDIDRFTEVLLTLRPRQHVESNVAIGLKAAAQLLNSSTELETASEYFEGSASRRRIVFLLHDGEAVDRLEDIVEALKAVKSLPATTMAIGSSHVKDEHALLGYVDGDRKRLYWKGSDRLGFGKTIRKICSAGTRLRKKLPLSFSSTGDARIFAAKNLAFGQADRNECQDRIDLMIVLDTSGSVYQAFEEQRRIAADVVEKLSRGSGGRDGRLRVALVRFAYDSQLIIPMDSRLPSEEIIERIRLTPFTGSSTRIATGVSAAIGELERTRRTGADQVLLLLSDGHGQETWRAATTAGARLSEHEPPITSFAVSASSSYNIEELSLYVKDKTHVYAGQRYHSFTPDFVRSIARCLQQSATELETSTAAAIAASTAKFTVSPLIQPATPNGEILVSATPSTVEKSEEFSTDFEGSGVPLLQSQNHGGSSDIFAVATEDLMSELQSAGRDKSRISLSAFPSGQAVGHSLRLPANRLDSPSNPHHPFAHSSGGCDVIVVIDRSQSVEEDFKHEITAARSAFVPSGPGAQDPLATGGVRVGIVSFASGARVDRPLSSGTNAEIQEAIGKIEHTGGATSAVAAMELVLRESEKRHLDSRLVVLLLSDGHSRDHWTEITKMAGKLREKNDTLVLALTVSEQYAVEELKLWAGSAGNVFTPSHNARWLRRVRVEMDKCWVQQKERLPLTFTPLPPKRPLEPLEDPGRQASTQNIRSRPTAAPLPITTTPEFKRASSTEKPAARGLPLSRSTSRSDCIVDLIFIIDISLSVEEAYQRQLQFALQLVDALPEADFVSGRIRVGIVSFNFTSHVENEIGEAGKSREELHRSLRAVPHTGGSTSVARGVNLSIDQFIAHRTPQSRAIAVLMSDGNSQDHWDDVLAASRKLRQNDVVTFAVTASEQYAFRELELYAGDKWHVYIDARIHVFLDDASTAIRGVCADGAEGSSRLQPLDKLTGGESPSSTTKGFFHTTTRPNLPSTPQPLLPARECEAEQVDVMILIDTSSGDEERVKELRRMAGSWVERLSEQEFENRLWTGVIRFTTHAQVAAPLGSTPTRSDVLYELARVGADEGRNKSSVVAAVDSAVREWRNHGRRGAMKVLVIASEGDSSDRFRDIEDRADLLLKENITVWIGSPRGTDEGATLLGLAGPTGQMFDDAEDLGEAIARSIACNGLVLDPVAGSTTKKPFVSPKEEPIEKDFLPAKNEAIFGLDEETKTVRLPKRCKKMDLMLIMDASTSREDVFEHQRELALSLLERLPIGVDEDAVAVGLLSFTDDINLRQPLGGGKSKGELRKLIESIPYHGGSTLTAPAVEAALEEIARGRRSEAVQVAVLMNDGRSQDLWDHVVRASLRFAESGAQRFVVALGPELDMRELTLYSPDNRLYTDGETEKFLHDVSNLLGDEACFLNPVERLGLRQRPSSSSNEWSLDVGPADRRLL